MTYDRRHVAEGPWPGGKCNTFDAYEIPPGHLYDIVNYDVKDDGTLKARPGIKQYGTDADGFTYKVLGRYLDTALVMRKRLSTGYCDFMYMSSPLNGAVDTVAYTYHNTSGGANYTNMPPYFIKTIEYNGFIYFISFNDGLTFSVSTSDYLNPATVRTVYSTYPGATDALIFKDRMFVAWGSGERLYFSKVTDPTDFTTPSGGGYIDVGGDGYPINRIIAQFDSLYIFKANSTYVLQYTDTPTDGTLRLISPDKGANDVALHDNNIYVGNDTSVYLFSNGSFIDIAKNIVMSVANKLFIGNNRLIVDGYLAMNLRTGAWSQWNTDGPFDGVTYPYIGPSLWDSGIYFEGIDSFFWGTDSSKLFSFTDKTEYASTLDIVNGNYIHPAYTFMTKVLDFGQTDTWKRLFWWSVDADLPSPSLATVTPETVTVPFQGSKFVTPGLDYSSIPRFPLAANKAVSNSARFRGLLLSVEIPAVRLLADIVAYDLYGNSLSLQPPYVRKLNLYVGVRTRVSQ